MKLKRGITGFWRVNEEPAPSLDFSLVKTKIYQIEYSGRYKILDIKDQEPSNNYYRISLAEKLVNQNVDILVNAQYPYYSGVTSDSEWMNLNFIDLPHDIRQCLDADYTYLDPINLNRKITSNDLTELSNAEIGEIKYWKSKTFGEIIFNGYD